MANYAPVKGSEDFERCPEGTFQIVISNFYNIGLQTRKDGSVKHQCIVLYEINKHMTQGEYAGKRFVISSYYNYTMSKNAQLRKDIEAIFEKLTDEEAATFDLDTLRGLNGQAKIEWNGEYTNIKNISSLLEGTAKLEPELPADYFPDWIKKKIEKQIKNSCFDASTTLPKGEAVKSLYAEINEWLTEGKITRPEVVKEIQTINGGNPVKFQELTEDCQLLVYMQLKAIADSKTVDF